MTDFEIAIRSAFVELVPTAEVTSCYFHFKQAVKKKARKFGAMMHFIMANSEAKNLYFKLMSLPLLPADRIRSVFSKLKAIAEKLQEEEEKDHIFDDFLRYFYNQWISGVHVCIIFSITEFVA